MRSAVPVIIVLALSIYCLINCVQAGQGQVRNLPKWAWIVLLIIFPLFGSVAYLFAGRPVPTGIAGSPGATGSSFDRPNRPRRQPPRGPDDDEDFLRGI